MTASLASPGDARGPPPTCTARDGIYRSTATLQSARRHSRRIGREDLSPPETGTLPDTDRRW